MKKSLFLLMLLIILIFTTACNQNLPNTPTPSILPTETPQVSGTEETGNSQTDLITLNIWVPPFLGLSDSPGYEIFHERLTRFSELHPGVRVEVRVKDINGPTSIYNSLLAASKAAPLALPDLAVLEISDIEYAENNGIIYPITDDLPDQIALDLFDFGLTLKEADENFLAIPFAIDAIILAYRTNFIDSPPTTWENLLETRGPLAFSAANPDSLFTITLYQSLGEKLQVDSDTGINQDHITKVFELYRSGQEANLFPFWLTQYENDEIVWQNFLEGRSQMAVVWSRTFLSNQNENIRASFIPTSDGTPYTLVNGLAWAITTPIEERQVIATELAAFLSNGEFTGQWSTETLFLPANKTGLNNLPEEAQIAILSNQVLPFGEIVPNQEILSLFGEIFRDNTTSILKLEKSPSQAISDILEITNQ